ncbi:class I SAM-dependent methyltransferase [Labrenzia sp. OB1]|uniref:class I SAM-dependent DNA methyltransferase n=1 Tax=Labrenzia sp. OB1 TaxID=1561204 RepID=UPI0007B23F0C|nr:class I SAM-dependent methyltransferase [Labrenzia sp. OB1]KZM49962.1 methyltransferase type 11 [Labrenzia sp. OB1]
MSAENPLLQQSVTLGGDPDTIRDFYKNWSDSYDSDLLLDIGYVAPQITAEALCRRVSDTALVLDAGCGTGLVGIELIKRKPNLSIDGIDLTPEMLEASRRKEVYRKLSEADMSGRLQDIDDDTYDGVVSAGVFTNGHVGPDGIDELIRITKPGAPVVLTVRDSAWEADGFKDKVGQLEAGGRTKSVEITHSPYHTKEDIFCQLVVLEVV